MGATAAVLAPGKGICQRIVADVFVYDLERAPPTACAGGRHLASVRRPPPVAALAAAVRAETGVPVTAAAVEYGLAALGRARLLAGERPAAGPTRRQVLARIGTAAAIPLVSRSPRRTAAQAQYRKPGRLTQTVHA